ncbi:hypothetical protein [Clostridium pasteurianum]|uniref:Uncharacterized protein n=1 Tax=Clostridium pasteurianum BC1 TaxID=86416 RepID=R4K2Q7_CLOPA|nr:hypothetical protein [Clostridium pasteurianum]AGK97392.1 hypothetical protein Clopa_2532 [Clostridium pasteurianum BC1]
MIDKDKLKRAIHSSVDDTIDKMDKIDHLDYFEINIKHVKGEILCKPSFTDKNRIK